MLGKRNARAATPWVFRLGLKPLFSTLLLVPLIITAPKFLNNVGSHSGHTFFIALINASIWSRYRSNAFRPAAVILYSVSGMRPANDFFIVT